MIHYLLILVIRHKCAMFDVNLPYHQCTLMNLIQILSPFVDTLRNHCIACNSSIPTVFIADIAHLFVRNKINKWTLAIDLNVYSKNQQFRLFNCVKYGKTNPLVTSTKFPFNSQLNLSEYDLLHKSLITFIENGNIPIIYFKENKFGIKSNITSDFDTTDLVISNYVNIELINEFIHQKNLVNIDTNKEKNFKTKNSVDIHKFNRTTLPDHDIEIFVNFIENMITSDASHHGYIHSCIRGSYNKNLLFFNITGNFRYCSQKKEHHRRNSTAIIVDIKNQTYAIRCKDRECDNSFLIWKKIK